MLSGYYVCPLSHQFVFPLPPTYFNTTDSCMFKASLFVNSLKFIHILLKCTQTGSFLIDYHIITNFLGCKVSNEVICIDLFSQAVHYVGIAMSKSLILDSF